MRAYVITIDRSSSKLERLLRQLNNIGLDIEVVDGIVPSENYYSFFDAKAFLNRYGRYPTRGEVGCALSHQEVYDRMVRKNELSSLVFEDDAILLEPFLSLLPTICQNWEGFGAVSFYSEGAFVSNQENEMAPKPTSFQCDNTLGYWISLRSALVLRATKISDNRLVGLADWPLAPQAFGLHLLTGHHLLHDSVASSLEVARQQQRLRLSTRWHPGKIRRSFTFWLYRTIGRCHWRYHKVRAGISK